jgi:hypothetical protein
MTKKFLLRINQELWEDLNRWAADELRSVNGQIEYVLRQAVEKWKRASPAAQNEPPKNVGSASEEKPQ